MVGPIITEERHLQLEKATLASLLTHDPRGAELAFVLLRDPTITFPDDVPSADLRNLLRDLCGHGAIRLDFLFPPLDSGPTLPSVTPCALCYLLISTLLRAAVRADGPSRLGALVAGSGVPWGPCPSLTWLRAARWLGARCSGAFRGSTLSCISSAIHLSREMGITLAAPTLSSPLEDWVVRAPSGRRYLAVLDLCHDVRNFPCTLNAFATLVFDYPIRVWALRAPSRLRQRRPSRPSFRAASASRRHPASLIPPLAHGPRSYGHC